MSESDRAIRGGQPSITTPTPPACDSPKVVTRKNWPNVFPMVSHSQQSKESLNHERMYSSCRSSGRPARRHLCSGSRAGCDSAWLGVSGETGELLSRVYERKDEKKPSADFADFLRPNSLFCKSAGIK